MRAIPRSFVFLMAMVPLALWAQRAAPRDAKGCVESKVVTRMPGCVISRCENKDFAAADMPRVKNERDHQVEGRLDRTIYRCPTDKSPLELGRNTEAALKNAGFNVFYTYVYGGGGAST